MWPFDIIRKYRIRKLYGNVLSKDVLQYLMGDDGVFPELPPPREGKYGFVIVQVAEGNSAHTMELVGKMIGLSVSHKAFIGHIVSSIVMSFFGTHDTCPLSSRMNLVQDIKKQYGSEARIIHGEYTGFFCNIGNDSRMSYGPLFPSTTRILQELINLEYGQDKEIEMN